jgi:hypothetical protein
VRLDHLLSKEHTVRPGSPGRCFYVDHWPVGALRAFPTPRPSLVQLTLVVGRAGHLPSPVRRRQEGGHGTTGTGRARRRRHCSVVREFGPSCARPPELSGATAGSAALPRGQRPPNASAPQGLRRASGLIRSLRTAERARASKQDVQYARPKQCKKKLPSYEEPTVDALAPDADEGRGWLRKATGSCRPSFDP